MLSDSWVGTDAAGDFVQAGTLGQDSYDDRITNIVCGKGFYETLCEYIKDKKCVTNEPVIS